VFGHHRLIASRAHPIRLLGRDPQYIGKIIFEELFTACKDKTQRKAFVDNLLYAASASGAHDGPTMVVLTLRADFYAQCFEHDGLREALSQRQATIGAMSADELRRTITEPAHQNGYDFEPGLVDLLLHDAGDEPGALPLLSHALLETWKRRDGRMLTLAGYQASGGVRGAIARTADSTLARLTEAQQAMAQPLAPRSHGGPHGLGHLRTGRTASKGPLSPGASSSP